MAAQTAPQITGKNAPEPRVAEVTVVKPAQDKQEKPVVPPAKIQEPATAATKAAVKPDAKIFVAPRAPDDPGPDEAETTDNDSFPKRVFRAVN